METQLVIPSSHEPSTIHNRMPAVLPADEAPEFFDGGTRWDFHPFAGTLVVAPCASPLTKPRDAHSQQELF
jgi:hypothetical protein